MSAFGRQMRWSLCVGGLLVAVVLVAVTAGSAGAAPPPKSVCGVCGDSLEGATDDGTLDIHVDEDGDSRWIVRVPVESAAAERYRTNASMLESAVESAWYGYDVAVDDATDVETRVEDESVVVEYTVGDVASEGVRDARLLDYLYLGGTTDRYRLQADTVRVHVPEDAAVTNDPANAKVDGRTVTWTQETASGIGGVSSTVYVTYAGDGIAGELASSATVVRAFGPAIVRDGAVAATVPAAVLALSTSMLGIVARRGVRRPGVVRRLSHGLGMTAVGAAIVDRLLGWRVRIRGLVGGAVVAAAAVWLVSWITFGATVYVEPAAFTLGVLLSVPFGYALEARGRAWPIALGILLVPALPIVAYAPYPYPWIVGVLFGFWALAMTLAGIPFVALGRSYGRTVAAESVR